MQRLRLILLCCCAGLALAGEPIFLKLSEKQTGTLDVSTGLPSQDYCYRTTVGTSNVDRFCFIISNPIDFTDPKSLALLVATYRPTKDGEVPVKKDLEYGLYSTDTLQYSRICLTSAPADTYCFRLYVNETMGISKVEYTVQNDVWEHVIPWSAQLFMVSLVGLFFLVFLFSVNIVCCCSVPIGNHIFSRSTTIPPEDVGVPAEIPKVSEEIDPSATKENPDKPADKPASKPAGDGHGNSKAGGYYTDPDARRPGSAYHTSGGTYYYSYYDPYSCGHPFLWPSCYCDPWYTHRHHHVIPMSGQNCQCGNCCECGHVSCCTNCEGTGSCCAGCGGVGGWWSCTLPGVAVKACGSCSGDAGAALGVVALVALAILIILFNILVCTGAVLLAKKLYKKAKSYESKSQAEQVSEYCPEYTSYVSWLVFAALFSVGTNIFAGWTFGIAAAMATAIFHIPCFLLAVIGVFSMFPSVFRMFSRIYLCVYWIPPVVFINVCYVYIFGAFFHWFFGWFGVNTGWFMGKIGLLFCASLGSIFFCMPAIFSAMKIRYILVGQSDLPKGYAETSRPWVLITLTSLCAAPFIYFAVYWLAYPDHPAFLLPTAIGCCVGISCLIWIVLALVLPPTQDGYRSSFYDWRMTAKFIHSIA
ncbi:hypothetical protein PAPYR_8306 [Paratrimastix pyriformis]|uniref:Uncharacterized protein n=1 Tax=Paratrimastix pyriformis TaxID=342808 RepID=A0ABQ8UAZ4_9EUKA|nr:hypothetical protein PAPYR_8306 [Paratrimastix pyriformis]